MKETLAEFFIPVSMDKGFQAAAGKWMADQDNYPWDTSIFKIIDNLVIGARRWQAEGEAEKSESEIVR